MNFNSEEVLLFIYELFHNGLKIWVQNKNIKIFVPNDTNFTAQQQDFLKNNKDKICHYLESNQIYIKSNKLVILRSELNSLALSFAQERLWFIEKYEEGTNAYNIPMVFKLSNKARLDILEKSVRSIVSRHEILRTLIKEDNEANSYQIVLDDSLNLLEIPKLKVTDMLQLDQELSKVVNYTYDLSNELPIKIYFFELIDPKRKKSPESYLSIVIHHIAFDGWSIDIFLRELESYYSYYLKQSQGLETDLNLPKLSIQYKDFAIWQRSYLSGERLNKQLNYWKNKLAGYETLNLITDKPRPSHIDYKGHDIYFELDEGTSAALRELAKELKVSLFSLLLAGYYLMLRSYSNQDDIVIGTPIANRHYSQIENLIGIFINSIALRIEVNSKISVKEFIQKIGNEAVESQLYQDLPFEKLVEELEIVKDISRHPIFQVIFGVQSFGDKLFTQSNEQKETNLINVLQIYTTKNLYNIAKFDISTYVDDSQVCLRGIFNYASSLYNETTINGFIDTYKEILNQFAALAFDSRKQEQAMLASITYLSKIQYEQIIYSWNYKNQEYPCDKTIHELFEKQVEKVPDNIAVIYQETKLTYLELNQKANQLANYLREAYDIKPDTLIALCLERSEHIIIAIIAVLKAGGAYVPIDTSYPDDRIKYILEDAKPKVILTNKLYKQRIDNSSCSLIYNELNVLSIDDIQVLKSPTTNLTSHINNANLAYVIYTSGTTGNPKGVLQLHSNIMRLFTSTDEWYHFNCEDVWTLFHSYVFDFSVWEIWGSLIYGGKLVIPTYEQTRDTAKFYELCKKEQVTVLNQTPTAFYQFSDIAVSSDIKLDNLRYVIFGGEALNFAQLKPWIDYYGYNQPKLINMYGITETTVHVTYKPIEPQDLNGNSGIGKLIPDLTAYILDSNIIPLPIGAVGELYIGGTGLARGYLNWPELTAEKFIANQFQTEKERKNYKNTRLYKTGDLARWLPDGSLEYIGRNDFQVKLRGYRIELKEIEAILSQYESIKQCVVIAKNENNIAKLSENKYLIAYYVSEAKFDEKVLIKYLQARLPEYMIPTVFVHLEKLPLTINGKLDRKALPNPEFTHHNTYSAPRNELENDICQIWSEVLKLDKEKIGIRDDFFRLGGNSILAIKLANKINIHYKAHVKVSDIFIYKTIELLMLRMLQTRKNYQTIVKLNNTYNKANMFMIHPGIGGCEVYISLANKLANDFSCYGIDSYNLYQDKKIDNLHELAKYYLSYIDKIMKETNQQIYHLLGWSIGGQISLEIASILEQTVRRGNKVKVYLLDSFLNDNHLLSLINGIDTEDIKNDYRNFAKLQGYEMSYIEKVITNIEIENKIGEQKISSLLANTQIVLFKAMIKEAAIKTDAYIEYLEYLSNLEYNNIDKILKNKSDIKLIKVNNAHHGNILEQEELLVNEITKL